MCLGPDSVLHSGVSAVAVHHGRRCCFHAVFPFIVGRPVLPSVYTAWTIAGSAVLGQVVLARRCTAPGAVYVRAVRSVARGDTIGAFLGRGLGHYDRCRGLDSAAGSLQDRRLSYCGAEAVPRCPGETPQLVFHGGRCPCCADTTGCSLPVVVPQVRLLDRSVWPVWWRLHRSGSWSRCLCVFVGAVVWSMHYIWRCRRCSSSSRTLTYPSWRRGFSHGPDFSAVPYVSPSCRTRGGCPGCAVASSATGAVLSMNVAVLTQRQVPAALCAGWAPGPFIDLSVGSV